VKEWFTGVVIGYNAKLNHNLVFYMRRLPGVPKCVDYYKAYLYPVGNGRRSLWKLLEYREPEVIPEIEPEPAPV
jgi:hypothetical protein